MRLVSALVLTHWWVEHSPKVSVCRVLGIPELLLTSAKQGQVPGPLVGMAGSWVWLGPGAAVASGGIKAAGLLVGKAVFPCPASCLS